MATSTSKSEAADPLHAATPAQLIARAEELLASAEGGIQLSGAKDIPAVKAALATAYAQLAVAKIAAAGQQ
jgi:hypothetical protein